VNTLRVKFAVLLVVAIVAVVGLLTVLLFYLLGPPKRAERALDGVAMQVETTLQLTSKGLGGVTLRDEPAPGRVYRRTTKKLREELKTRGLDLPVTVSRAKRHAPLIVSIPIDDKGWLWMPTSGMPPSGPPWKALFRWLTVIALGAAVIAVFVSNRMVRPLALLEKAVASVGPDGLMPELPERGSAEVRATAKALNSLSARLKRAMESRMRLVAAAGHDMRTPITRMRLRAEFVQDHDERDKWLEDLDELERIADSAIMLVREETGNAAPELLRLDELVGAIGTELKEFEPFFRADPARRQDIPGAGLGLTIAYEIVSRAGGRIAIANRPGGGLLQTVELPEAETEADS
jgi:HAMP domain-containing protein